MLRWILAVILMGLCIAPAVSRGDSEPHGVPALVLLQVDAEQAVFEKASWDKPIELSSKKQAEKYFKGKALQSINEQIDWSVQTVLVFAWQGSGGDEYEAEVKRDEDDAPSVEFTYTPGLTLDYQPHIYVYAVRNGVPWKAVEAD